MYKKNRQRSQEGRAMGLLRLYFSILSLVTFCFLGFIGCIGPTGKAAPVVKMPERLPANVKAYKGIVVPGNYPGLMGTGVRLNEGEPYTVLATGVVDRYPRHSARISPGDGALFSKIGNGGTFPALSSGANAHTTDAIGSGELHLGISDGGFRIDGTPKTPHYYRDNEGFFSVGVVVWKRKDYALIADSLEVLKKRDPENRSIHDALKEVNAYREYQLASEKTSKQIEQTKKEIHQLKTAEKAVSTPPGPAAGKTQAGTPEDEVAEQEQIDRLEEKLGRLKETFAQLEDVKTKLEDERKRTTSLAQELEEKEKKEKDLVSKLKEGSRTSPVIVITSPKESSRVEINMISLSGVAEDDQGLEKVEIFINDKPLKREGDRGIKVTAGPLPKRLEFHEQVPLEAGPNEIKVRALDADGIFSEKVLMVHRTEMQKNVWAAVIGINAYPMVPQLRYAVNDAMAFYSYLVERTGIPAENVTLLLDQDATLSKLRSTLGTGIKNKAGKDDMVILYFAGHGATERDAMSMDGDGLEKYLLPYDADPKDLYASALPMREISHIFQRIRSERLIFIVDACYSGASGGRTIAAMGRANISDAFLDRIASGRGTVILSASSANEVSAENEQFQHGVFTYYLLQALQGEADVDKDGLITVEEAYTYVSREVPKATGQEQHPVKKGSVEGTLILGVTR